MLNIHFQVIKRKRREFEEKEKSNVFTSGTENDKVIYNNVKNVERERADKGDILSFVYRCRYYLTLKFIYIIYIYIDEDVDFWSRKRKAFLDLLFEYTKQEGQTWTDQELNDEVSTMMIAGNDTTATVACFTMMMLGIHKHYQVRPSKNRIDRFLETHLEIQSP